MLVIGFQGLMHLFGQFEHKSEVVYLRLDLR